MNQSSVPSPDKGDLRVDASLIAYHALCGLLFPAAVILAIYFPRFEGLIDPLPEFIRYLVGAFVLIVVPFVGGVAFSGWGNYFAKFRLSAALLILSVVFVFGLRALFDTNQWVVIGLLVVSQMAVLGWRVPALKWLNAFLIILWIVVGAIVASPLDWFFSEEFKDMLPRIAVWLSAGGLSLGAFLILRSRVSIKAAEFP